MSGDTNFNKAVFYVMSGTGNTFRVASWIKELFGERGTKAEIIMIEDADCEKDFDHSSDSLIGLLFPAHGFMPPWSMIKFLFRMPKRKKVPVFCAATRGALRVGPILVPGASGLGTFFAALIMLLKGYSIKAIFSLDMPANMINLHWGLHQKNIEKISNRSQKRLKRIVPRILGGHSIFFTLNNLWESLWAASLLWLMPVFPILYLIIGKLFMAKAMFSNHHCVGCGRCARFCSNNAIVMKDVGDIKRPYWTYHCEICLRCMGYCKKRAVEAGHSWAVLLYFITSIPVISYLFTQVNNKYEWLPVISNYWALETISSIYYIPALLLSYWLFWYLVRIPFFNKIFTYTTLTHYYRRYHQPETKLKHMVRNTKKKTKDGDY